MPVKLKYEEVVKRFKKGNCELLESVYINSRTKMKYRCECGNVSYITLDNFRSGARCKKCASNKISIQRSLSAHEVDQLFKDNNCKMLGRYIRSDIPVKYRCECGNISKILIGNLRKGQRCSKCGVKKNNESRRFSYAKVKSIFEDAKCKLITKTYINAFQKLKYECSCGNISKISLSSFQQGHRCRKCGVEKVRTKVLGKKHWNYNPNLTEKDRQRWRWYYLPEYMGWRKEVFGRDRYRCQCCRKQGGNLNAHHKESFNNNSELRLNVNNGITLCKTCHDLFHSIYGKGNNTTGQLEIFLYDFGKYGGEAEVIIEIRH